jgi:predicted component of type VI protein secretion system
MLFNAGGGSNGSELLLEVTHVPARHGEALYETLAGAAGAWKTLAVLASAG